jgi:hypothetical protein
MDETPEGRESHFTEGAQEKDITTKRIKSMSEIDG